MLVSCQRTSTAVRATKGKGVKRKLSLRDSSNELTRSWRGALPAGGRDALRQFSILLACYVAYDMARIAVRGREALAMANAQGIINAEKALHLYVEPYIQTMASHVHALVVFMDWFYGSIHIQRRSSSLCGSTCTATRPSPFFATCSLP